MKPFMLSFEFSGVLIERVVPYEEPASVIFSYIAARNTMLDPGVAKDIVADNGINADFNSIFNEIAQEYQKMYLFGGIPMVHFYDQARRYACENEGNEYLLEVIKFSEENPPLIDYDGFDNKNNAACRSKTKKDKEKQKKKAAHKSKMRNRR